MMLLPPLIISDPCRGYSFHLDALEGSPVELHPDKQNEECNCPVRIFVFDYEKQVWYEEG